MCESSDFWRENSNYLKHRVFKQVLNHISDLSCAILGPYLDYFLDTTIQNLLGHPVDILSSLRSQKVYENNCRRQTIL